MSVSWKAFMFYFVTEFEFSWLYIFLWSAVNTRPKIIVQFSRRENAGALCVKNYTCHVHILILLGLFIIIVYYARRQHIKYRKQNTPIQ